MDQLKEVELAIDSARELRQEIEEEYFQASAVFGGAQRSYANSMLEYSIASDRYLQQIRACSLAEKAAIREWELAKRHRDAEQEVQIETQEGPVASQKEPADE